MTQWMICRGMEGTPTIVDKQDAMAYELIQTDDMGVCLNADEGSKTQINSVQLSHSSFETVAENVCATLIASGACPMVAWGLLRIKPDSF